MNSDTVILLLVALAVLFVLVETVREAFHDGPAAQGPPRSHEEDPRFGPPSSSAA